MSQKNTKCVISLDQPLVNSTQLHTSAAQTHSLQGDAVLPLRRHTLSVFKDVHFVEPGDKTRNQSKRTGLSGLIQLKWTCLVDGSGTRGAGGKSTQTSGKCWTSMTATFGSTYFSDSAFSHMIIMKFKYQCSMTDHQLDACWRLATSNYCPANTGGSVQRKSSE